MTISVWRYSHLALAVSSFLLLTLAAVTGIILSFQPVSEKLQPYKADNFSRVTLVQSLPALRKVYPGISELTVDANQFVQVKGSNKQGKKLLAYVDPVSGKILGVPGKQNEFFQWITTLHRSLFLHGAGRFFVGLTAFLLLLIAISGTILVIKRQRGIKYFFKRIVRDGFFQYYHVLLGRWSLIPIIILASTGTYLSLEKFELIKSPKVSTKVDFDAIKSKPLRKAEDFAVFKETYLSDVISVELPFSEDAEDYYTIKLKDREIAVNQITGDILSEVKYPTTVILTNLSLNLHTGRASGIWAIVLAIASVNILFFIYSGFAITLKRRSNRVKNKYKANESRFIILVGSENGSTYRFANAVHKQLLRQGEKSFITELNNYQVFARAEHLIVMSATYGIGEAPTNAAKFASLLQKYPQQQPVKHSVVGFGSHAYPDFCKFPFEINQLLVKQSWAKPLTDIHTVNDKSPQEFMLWAEAWSQQTNIALDVLPELQQANAHKLQSFTVESLVPALQSDGAFSIRLQAKRGLRVISGDLLAIYPENDHRERLYSIGVVNKAIQLSVRLHTGGLGSGYLHQLQAGEKIRARVVNNEHFHFPWAAPQVVMIANGTGIAPFLGMISQNRLKTPCYLYGGFRDSASYQMYKPFLEGQLAVKQVSQLKIALSREGEKQYVSDLVAIDGDLIANVFSNKGVVMICGSLTMQKDVMEMLDKICNEKTGQPISYYQSHGQILTDCY